MTLWLINQTYAADPLRIRREHRPCWWQRLLGKCGCGLRRPCPALRYANAVLDMEATASHGERS